MTIKLLPRSGTRIILISFAVVVAMMIFSAAVTGAPDYVAGDVNGDGFINVKDVIMVQKKILGLQYPPLTAVQLLAADVNGDGEIDLSDAVKIMQIALGIVDSYPMPIVSLNDAVVRVPINTALADINLPTTVEANFAGGIKRNIGVRWERVSSPAYNPFVFDEYIFKGDLINLPSGVRNPAGLRATARVSFLLRDPWPFPGTAPAPDNQYLLTLVVDPVFAGTPMLNGVAQNQNWFYENESVVVGVSPNPGFQFSHWRRGVTNVSSFPIFTFQMPPVNTTLTAVFGSSQGWDLRMDGIPVIFPDDFITTVSVYILPDDVGQVTGVRILDQPALQDSQNPARWHRAFNQPVSLSQLVGQITVYPVSTPGAQQIIDGENSSALYDILPSGGVVTVWVAIRPNHISNVTAVYANGIALTKASGYENYYGSLTGLAPGDPVTVTAFTNQMGTDTEILIVQNVNP